MNVRFTPTPLDEATRLDGVAANPLSNAPAAPEIQTESFTGNPVDMGTLAQGGQIMPNIGIGQPLAAAINIIAGAAQSSHTNETYSFQLMDSPDGLTWSAIGPAVAVNAPGWWTVPGFRTQRFVAAALTIAGTAPTITYNSWLTTQGFPR